MKNAPPSFAALPKDKQDKMKRLLARELALEAMQRRSASKAKCEKSPAQE